jgi:hypothetical protein
MANQLDDLSGPLVQTAILKAQLYILALCDETRLGLISEILERAKRFEEQGFPEFAAIIRKRTEPLFSAELPKIAEHLHPMIHTPQIPALPPQPSPAPEQPRRGPGRPRKNPPEERNGEEPPRGWDHV